MLSFELKVSEYRRHPDEMEIILDSDGLESLLAQLKLLKEKRTEHIHLMSESWGGTHLDDQPHNKESVAIHSVKILFREP